mgnify:CR=1 FL=1
MSRKVRVNQERRERRSRRAKKLFLFIFLVVIASSLAYAGYVGAKMYQAWEKIQNESNNMVSKDPDELVEKMAPKKNEPFSLLILGIDDKQASHMHGLSDVIMVAIVNPQTKKVSLLSIPRDTYTEIVGLGYKDKINHAYAKGGIEMAIATVEKFLDIKIDHWAAINLDGFRDLVNLLGGLHIYAEKDMYHHYKKENIVINIKQGPTVLNGDEALYYVRFRKDAEGDFGRNRRQQQVIKALLDQTLTMRNVTKVGEMIDVVGDNFRTDITATEMLGLVRQFATLSGEDVESLRIEGKPGDVNNMSVVFIDEAEQKRIQQELKARLYNTHWGSPVEQAGQWPDHASGQH